MATAVDKMCKHNIRRLPVMDNGQVVGILTTTDILNDLQGEVVSAENVFNSALEGFVILRK